MNKFYFIQGERRILQFLVESTKGERIVITGAVFSLTLGDRELDRGNCEIIDGDILQVTVDCSECGALLLEITYTIAPETRKVRCVIDVT